VKPILAIEQDPTLPGLGLLGKVVRARGLPIVSAHAWEGDLDNLRASDFAGIVPLGGSMQSWDEQRLPYLRDERELLREAVDDGVPVLGICLGAQVLARALGAEVRTAERPEVGWQLVEGLPAAMDDKLLSHLREPSASTSGISTCSTCRTSCALAHSALSANQAFRYGERTWGCNSTPRSTPALLGWIKNWAERPSAWGSTRALEASVAAVRRTSPSRSSAPSARSASNPQSSAARISFAPEDSITCGGCDSITRDSTGTATKTISAMKRRPCPAPCD
jgi:GMP synthase (glutamine-hydrolysing)